MHVEPRRIDRTQDFLCAGDVFPGAALVTALGVLVETRTAKNAADSAMNAIKNALRVAAEFAERAVV